MVEITCANTIPETLVFKQPKIVADTGDGNGRGNKDMPGGEHLMCAKGGHTSDEPMALRFCKWKGYKHARSFKTGGHSGPCALFFVDKNGKVAGRRWDGGHGTRMSEITCSEPKK